MIVGGGDDFGDVRTVAEAAGERHLQHMLVRGAFEVVVGPYYFGSAAAAEFLETLADACRSFYLKVGETCPGLDCQAETVFRIRTALSPAGCHQRGVAAGKQFLNLPVVKRAEVQSYLGHLDLRAFENGYYLVKCLVLYRCADHIFPLFLFL